ncbi:MAG: leucine-rich repeat domain-containing protein [Bacteroides sp.]|nr:leucine-rich repeat domain-containing protein [Bacteroides sp.]MCM1379979.1 leucine-rich repeat domain-containing protein [Bacteroides sp.]MCM1446266.1 leucine-rich repeat domain-containing protein [Prevotella sp.]
MKISKFITVGCLLATTMCLQSCGKDEEPSWNDDNSESEIGQGPDQVIGDNLIRVDNLLYEINEDGTCTLLYSKYAYDKNDNAHLYFSTFPTPEFNIPENITLGEDKYQVSSVNLNGEEPYEKENNAENIKYMTIPSSVLSYIGSYCIYPTTLTIGANVRSVSNAKAEKIFWLPNTPPSGYNNSYASVQYASSTAYGSSVIIYPHLSSLFTVNEIAYVMSDPANRRCDMVGAFSPISGNIETDGTVTKDGITFTIDKIAQYAFFGCENIHKVSISNITDIEDNAFSDCSNLREVYLSNILTMGDGCFSGCAFSTFIIPGSVTSLGTGAFLDCTNLSELSFADGDGTLYIKRPSSSAFSTPDFNTFSGTRVRKIYIASHPQLNIA